MTRWNAIQEELGRRSSPAPAAGAEIFWADFKARAQLTRQEEPRPARHPFLWTSAALAGAAAIWLLILGFPGSASAANRITSLEVEAPHSGAMILNVTTETGNEAGAIVWVSGLEESP